MKVAESKLKEEKEADKIVDHVERMDIDIDTEMKIKTESEDLDTSEIAEELSTEEKRPKKHSAPGENDSENCEIQPPSKIWRGLRYKTWAPGAIQPSTKYKKPTEREITEVSLFILSKIGRYAKCKATFSILYLLTLQISL